MAPSRSKYSYRWPNQPLSELAQWQFSDADRMFLRALPESLDELARDSRWPAFFPSPMCFVTVNDGRLVALEKVVGPSIVNRYPYLMALSFCRQSLSARHHVRDVFCQTLERSGGAAVQFISPGPELDSVMEAVLNVPQDEADKRIAATRLPVKAAATNAAPIFDAAYLVYEGRLVEPGQDLNGVPICPEPWVDVGSHRIYLLEINAIQLSRPIAEGGRQIHWRGLPAWQPAGTEAGEGERTRISMPRRNYQKSYTPHYAFPSRDTIAFQANANENGRSILHLPSRVQDQIQLDNDRSRWPCFFPSSVGMITSWVEEGVPNLMPCGSTTVVSRHPLVIAPCVSYAKINQRYAPRASLEIIRKTGRFGCGVPFINDEIVDAIRYAGNVSIVDDADKVKHSGLKVLPDPWAPVLPELPIHFDCEVIGEVPLGTHIMFLGEVRKVRVRSDVTPANPLEWIPWATAEAA